MSFGERIVQVCCPDLCPYFDVDMAHKMDDTRRGAGGIEAREDKFDFRLCHRQPFFMLFILKFNYFFRVRLFSFFLTFTSFSFFLRLVFLPPFLLLAVFTLSNTLICSCHPDNLCLIIHSVLYL